GHRPAPITQCDPSRGPVRRQIAEYARLTIASVTQVAASDDPVLGMLRLGTAKIAMGTTRRLPGRDYPGRIGSTRQARDPSWVSIRATVTARSVPRTACGRWLGWS